MKKTACLVALLALLGTGREASAQSTETWVQDNGLSCKPDNGLAGSWERSFAGFKNIATFDHWLYCPLSPPTQDSSAFFNPEIRDLYVLYTSSGAVPECYEYASSKTGSVLWSAQGVATNAFFSKVINFSSPFKASSQGLAIGYACLVPVGVTINGAFFRSPIATIAGGV